MDLLSKLVRASESCPNQYQQKHYPFGVLSTKVNVRLFSLKSVSCTATRLATIATTLTLSGLNLSFRSQVLRDAEHSIYQARKTLTLRHAMFSVKRSSSAGKIPSWIISMVAMIWSSELMCNITGQTAFAYRLFRVKMLSPSWFLPDAPVHPRQDARTSSKIAASNLNGRSVMRRIGLVSEREIKRQSSRQRLQ